MLTSTSHQLIQFAMLEPPVRTHNNDLLPGMAKTWETSADGMTYTFHLRDATWSDSKPDLR